MDIVPDRSRFFENGKIGLLFVVLYLMIELSKAIVGYLSKGDS